MSRLLPETPEEHALRFPKLSAAQIAQLEPFCTPRHPNPGDVVYDVGSADHGVFIVQSGSLEIIGVNNGVETVVTVLEPGEFTGEISLLSGRRALVRCR